MHIGILGINHKSAPLELREKLAKVCNRLFHPHSFFTNTVPSVLLSTCNRTEIYFSSQDPSETHTYFLSKMRSELEEEFEHRVYAYFGSDCFFHLARVTAGMDSALVGETEIQGQVKQAYESAIGLQPLSKELHFLFQKSLKIGKQIRASTSLTKKVPSIEEAILQAGETEFGTLHGKKLLFVGISEINYKIFRTFAHNGLTEITLCNRTDQKAETIAKKEQVKHLSWRELSRWYEYDLVLCATKSPDFLLHKAPVRISPTLLVDLSVPRNIDPRLNAHPGITLLNLDELNHSLNQKQQQKLAEIAYIESKLILEATKRQVNLFKLKELRRTQGLFQHAS
ncbi:MAG: Glutamyl-tRNA reductase [Chlamydiae bacterium]|nr:Glutamyl-tRNA reductase [Chlamydiota bacterium]